jgi:hypothetical protein
MLWYSPALFGKKYMKMMGISEKEMAKNQDKMMPIMIQALILDAIMAYVLVHVLVLFQASSIAEAVQVALWVWLGFIATSTYMLVLYEKKTMDYWIMTAGHYLFALIAIAIVIVTL